MRSLALAYVKISRRSAVLISVCSVPLFYPCISFLNEKFQGSRCICSYTVGKVSYLVGNPKDSFFHDEADTNFSNRQALANSANPDQTPLRGKV